MKPERVIVEVEVRLVWPRWVRVTADVLFGAALVAVSITAIGFFEGWWLR